MALSAPAATPTMELASSAAGRRARLTGQARLLGPAFVAAVAYVDPGNVATNTAAGARYGYLLLWVLIGATLAAALIQYLSAKVGWLTGESLPALIGARTGRRARLAYWVQAELVAMATDVAEVVGGAIALQILFGLPLLVGAGLTALVSTALLLVADRRGQAPFERMITGLLAVVGLGFVAGLLVVPPDPGAAAAGLVPRLQGTDSALLAVGMLGATVMPHAVHVHSALVRDRHGRAEAGNALAGLRAIRSDVVLAMVVAGGVNVAMLLLSAGAPTGLPVEGLPQVHDGLAARLGGGVATLFAVGLLASGFASTSVGGYAGSVVMAGLLRRRVPLLARRAVTVVPALALLATGLDPTRLLIVSQVVLSFGIPFALVPLVRTAADRGLMGLAPTRRTTVVVAWTLTGAIVALNAALLVLLLHPAG